jgi:hypothetical protein
VHIASLVLFRQTIGHSTCGATKRDAGNESYGLIYLHLILVFRQARFLCGSAGHRHFVADHIIFILNIQWHKNGATTFFLVYNQHIMVGHIFGP